MNILYVTELPEAFLALGTKLRLVLSFFTLRSDFMDLNMIKNKDTSIVRFIGRFPMVTGK